MTVAATVTIAVTAMDEVGPCRVDPNNYEDGTEEMSSADTLKRDTVDSWTVGENWLLVSAKTAQGIGSVQCCSNLTVLRARAN